MGYAIAMATLRSRHEVRLAFRLPALVSPAALRDRNFKQADEMATLVHQQSRNCDFLVCCACLWPILNPSQSFQSKIKKASAPNLSLRTYSDRDILASASKNRKYIVSASRAELENVEANALKKLEETDCDGVVSTDCHHADSGMEIDEN